MASSVVELERLVVRLQGDATDYLDMLSKAERSTADFVKRIEGQLTAVTLGVAAPLAGIGGAGIKAFADFDQGMKKALAIMPATDAQIKQMRDSVLDLSGQTIQGPAELSSAFYTLASAGLNAEQSIAALPAVARFATAGNFDLARATYTAVTAQGALGLRVEDASENLRNLTRITDVLSKANTIADATIEDFARALTTQAGVSLRAFRKDVEEGAAVLAVMSQQGVKAEVAGTNLSRILRLLAQTSEKNSVQQAALGFKVFDSSGKMRNLADIVQNLEKILGPMSTEMRAATLSVLGFDSRIQQSIFPLLGMSDRIRDFETKLRGAGGATKEISDKFLRSFMNQMTMLGNQVRVVGVEIGEILAPALTLVGMGLSYLVKLLRSLDPNTKLMIVSIGAVTVGLISFAAAALGAVKVLAFLFAGIGGAIFGGIMLGILGLAGTIGVLISRSGGIETTFTTIQKALSDFWEFLVPVRTGVVVVFGALRGALTDAGVAVSLFVQRVSNVLQVEAVLDGIPPLWERLRDVAVTALYYIAAAIQLLGPIAKLGFYTLGEGVIYLIYNFESMSNTVLAWARSLIVGNSFVITLALSIAAAVVVFKILSFVLSALGITQLLWNGLVLISTTVQWAWTTALVVGKGAVWLFNAALTAMNILMTPLGLAIVIAAAALAIPFTFGLIAAASAAYALVGALQGIWFGLGTLLNAGGPIQYILALFGEWGNILRDVATTARTDLPRAFVILRFAAELALNQIRDLWPPLWTFIQSGTVAIWTYVTTQFQILFKTAFYNIYAYILEKGDDMMLKLLKLAASPLKALADAVVAALSGKGMKAAGIVEDAVIDLAAFRALYKKDLAAINEDSAAASTAAAALLKKQLEDAAAVFSVPASDATREAKEALDYLRKGFVGPMPELVVKPDVKPPEIPGLDKDWMKMWEQLGEDGGKVLHKGLGKEIERFEAVLSRSAEAVTRLEEYRTRIEAPESVFKGKVGIELPKRFDAADAGGAEKKTREEEQLDVLKKINEAIRLGLKKPGVDIAPAGI